MNPLRHLLIALLLPSACARQSAPGVVGHEPAVPLPILPEVVVDNQFKAAEGIAFSGEGRLFVTADRKLWETMRNGTTRRVADLGSTVGLAAIGARDVLVAEFGQRIRLTSGSNSDGVILRITPEGMIDSVAVSLGDPNFILVRKNKSGGSA